MSISRLLFVALLCLAGCATKPEPVPQGGGARPFTINSESSGFTVRGRFDGTIELRREEIVVAVKDGRVLSRTEDQPDVKLRACIAGRGIAEVAERIAQSTPEPIGGFVKGEPRALAVPITFRIPMPKKFDPESQWLVFEFLLAQGTTTYACETDNLAGPAASGPKRNGLVCWSSSTY